MRRSHLTRRNNWLNQSTAGFEQLPTIADRQTKFAKTVADEQAVFGLFTNAVKSNRDEWVYDFEVANLRNKALFFTDTYNASLDNKDETYNSVIKWSSTLRNRLQRGERIVYNDGNRIQSLYRPFVTKWHFADIYLNDRLTKKPLRNVRAGFETIQLGNLLPKYRSAQTIFCIGY